MTAPGCAVRLSALHRKRKSLRADRPIFPKAGALPEKPRRSRSEVCGGVRLSQPGRLAFCLLIDRLASRSSRAGADDAVPACPSLVPDRGAASLPGPGERARHNLPRPRFQEPTLQPLQSFEADKDLAARARTEVGALPSSPTAAEAPDGTAAHRAPEGRFEFQRRHARRDAVYAALDLGTNNCRLLIARPASGRREGFRVIDSFSRIVRLGESLSRSGELGSAAVERTIEALEVCRDKMHQRGVTRARLVATEACRAARNGAEFVAKVREKTGLEIEIVDRETEARLAAAGSASLADQAAEGVLLFDIGGGSSEIVWLARSGPTAPAEPRSIETELSERIRFWVSLKLGVVTLAEMFGGLEVSDAVFEAMIDHVMGELASFVLEAASARRCGHFHLLGTSGTVTTIAGVFLGLARYDRRRVDGLWMSSRDVDRAVASLRSMSYEERTANACIGFGRADLVLAGCAILEAIRRAFPAERIRIADRGLREGILLQMMSADAAAAARESA
jgi:exopolyphosphatase/guanosine-5'-triphosphate,3'-diphosphate pyrophosphatase